MWFPDVTYIWIIKKLDGRAGLLHAGRLRRPFCPHLYRPTEPLMRNV